MRILGFSQKWAKLDNARFTTFRFTRRDRDWTVGEMVDVVYRPRSKKRRILGLARIVKKEIRAAMLGNLAIEVSGVPVVTHAEAEADGFPGGVEEMLQWLKKAGRPDPTINKLTLRWVARYREWF